MTYFKVHADNIGEVGTFPQFLRIQTNLTVAQITASGYLNRVVKEGISLSPYYMAIVATVSSATSASTVGFYNVVQSSGNWSLIAYSS